MKRDADPGGERRFMVTRPPAFFPLSLEGEGWGEGVTGRQEDNMPLRDPHPRLRNLARAQRRSDNVAARYLWQTLRNRQLGGLKFRRELPVPPYIADFACIDIRLIIELDGSQHIDNANDIVRDRFLNEAGWSVARFPSGSMLSAQEAVLETIAALCDGRIAAAQEAPGFIFRPAAQPS